MDTRKMKGTTGPTAMPEEKEADCGCESGYVCGLCFREKYDSLRLELEQVMKENDQCKIDASNWAYQCECAKRDRDIAEAYSKKAREALKMVSEDTAYDENTTLSYQAIAAVKEAMMAQHSKQ